MIMYAIVKRMITIAVNVSMCYTISIPQQGEHMNKKIGVEKMDQSIIDHAIDLINDGIGEGVCGCDLHHELFNTDYFIIGYYHAEKFLSEGPGIFNAINAIKDYEKENFGSVSTDLSCSEKVANMYAYIRGEELLGYSDTLQDKWNELLTKEDLQAIAEEIA